VGFDPTTPVFEREKTVRASDRAATVIGDFFVYPHITKMCRACSMNGERRNAYRMLVCKPEGKRPLRRRRRRWVDNIKMDLREIAWGGMDWIDVAQYRD
jgi:hypothetical protein